MSAAPAIPPVTVEATRRTFLLLLSEEKLAGLVLGGESDPAVPVVPSVVADKNEEAFIRIGQPSLS